MKLFKWAIFFVFYISVLLFVVNSSCTVRMYKMPITVTSAPGGKEGAAVKVPPNTQTLELTINISADIPKEIDVNPDIKADVTPSIIPK